MQVQVGEIGNAEGAPATWVMAQVGTGQPPSRCSSPTGPSTAPPCPRRASSCSGTRAVADRRARERVGGRHRRARRRRTRCWPATGSAPPPRCRRTATPRANCRPRGRSSPPIPLPPPPRSRRAVETALGCRASPLQRFQAVAGGDPIEVVPSFGGDAVVNVDKVVFTSATTAVAQYRLAADQGQQQTGAQYAAATLHGSTWQLSLASVAPGIQVTPANQVGNVDRGPRRPVVRAQLARRHRRGGVQGAARLAVVAGLRHRRGGVHPAGGIVEEVTTPDAVGVVTSALFPNYATPLISRRGVGGRRRRGVTGHRRRRGGRPPGLVGVGHGLGRAPSPRRPPVAKPSSSWPATRRRPSERAGLAAPGERQHRRRPRHRVAPGRRQRAGRARRCRRRCPLLRRPEPRGPPIPRRPPQAITAAFSSVFDCNTPPIQRVDEIQDGSLVAGALEQLDTGPYEALASSTLHRRDQASCSRAPPWPTCRTRCCSTPTPG